MKAITLAVNALLPEELRDDNIVLDKTGVSKLLVNVAKHHPDKYAEIAKGIADLGRKAAYLQGETLTLKDMRPPFDKDGMLAQMDKEMHVAKRQAKSPEDVRKVQMEIWGKYANLLEKETMRSALATGNNLGNTVVSGARGNPFQLKAMVATPAMYTDYKNQTIPRFIRRSYGEGLRPADYLASSYGVRSSIISTKKSTAEGGDLLKMMSQATTPLMVTEEDCGTGNGIDFDPGDKDLMGRLTTRAYPGVPAGTPIDRMVFQHLQKAGIKKVIARSPMTCQAKEGICAKCLGELPEGHLAPVGYAAGITAAQSIGEPVVQGSLSHKHEAGGFKGTKKTFAGFDVIEQLVQSPETFPHRAAVAETAGRVEGIEDAPQGGKFISVGGIKHYALPGYSPTVKPGDLVEAGDQLSDGIVDVADVVKHRGLGEGRRYYVDRLKQALEESGAGKPSKLNLELLARGALDHVRIEDPDGVGDYLPDDNASYGRLVNRYEPPKTAKVLAPAAAVDHYLETPALHYTIGTKLTPKMVTRLKDAGINQVVASKETPKFVPEMVRLRAATHNNQDWFSRLSTSYLGANISDAVERSLDTNTQENVHPAPRLAAGLDFGKKIQQTGKF